MDLEKRKTILLEPDLSGLMEFYSVPLGRRIARMIGWLKSLYFGLEKSLWFWVGLIV